MRPTQRHNIDTWWGELNHLKDDESFIWVNHPSRKQEKGEGGVVTWGIM